MSDEVKSKEDAIKIADTFLVKVNEMRKMIFEEEFRKQGEEVIYPFINYTLQEITEGPKGWVLTYFRDVNAGDPIQRVSVNRLTGEAKAGDFHNE